MTQAMIPRSCIPMAVAYDYIMGPQCTQVCGGHGWVAEAMFSARARGGHRWVLCFCMFMCVHVHMHMHIPMHVHAHAHAHTHKLVHPSVCARARTACVRVCACMRAHVRVHAHVRVCARMCLCMRAHVRYYVHDCLLTFWEHIHLSRQVRLLQCAHVFVSVL